MDSVNLPIPYIILILWLLVIFLYGTYRTAYDEGYDAGKKNRDVPNGKVIVNRGYVHNGHAVNFGTIENVIRVETYNLKMQMVKYLPFKVRTWVKDRITYIEVSLTVIEEQENEKEG